MNASSGGLLEPREDDSTSTDAYRAHLDGLRALAVYLVVLFHAGSTQFSGGYIGVDVFFVLSGFLVTQLLLRDVARSGTIRFSRFYSRRFRRLLPAAFVALLVTAAVFTAVASPAEVRDSVGSFKAAFLYSTNWYFIHNATGYFGADITTNPVLHFWSLAVEEQFYLVWPLALGGAFVMTRRWSPEKQMRAIRIAVAVGAVASVVWALSLRTTNPNRAYYGTDARAYELLAGAFIALVPDVLRTAVRFRDSMKASSVLCAAALILLASSWIHLDAIERGIAVTIATGALIVALEASAGGFAKRALSYPAVVYLGRISYGTYLWHWLVIVVVARTFHISTIATIGITCVVATALASLSYVMLETPVRTSPVLDRYRRPVIAFGLAISVLSALVIIPRIVNPANAATPVARSSSTVGFLPVTANVDWRGANKGAGPFVNCLHKPVSACTVVRGAGPSVLLMGDSHAWMFIPAFTAVAREHNLTLSVSVEGHCPWQQDLYVIPFAINGRTATTQACKAQKDDTYARVIPALHPDVVVVVNVTHDSPGTTTFLGPDGNVVANGSPASMRWVETTTTRSLAELRVDGTKVMIIEPIPVAPFDTRTCLSAAKVLAQCRFVTSATPDWLETFYRQQAQKDHDVFSADFDRLVCPYLPICDPVVNGQVVSRDGDHLSEKFAMSLAPQIGAYLKSSGLIPGS